MAATSTSIGKSSVGDSLSSILPGIDMTKLLKGASGLTTDTTKLAKQTLGGQSDLLKQFFPDFYSSIVGSVKAESPGLFATQDQLQQQIQENLGQGLSTPQLDFFTQKLLAAQESTGIATTQLGATARARDLTQLDMAQQQQNTQNAQNFIQGFKTGGEGLDINAMMQNITGQMPDAGSLIGSLIQMMTAQQQQKTATSAATPAKSNWSWSVQPNAHPF
jgi:hypothetical protein